MVIPDPKETDEALSVGAGSVVKYFVWETLPVKPRESVTVKLTVMFPVEEMTAEVMEEPE